MAQPITLDEEQATTIRTALDQADDLVSMVISGQPNQIAKALSVARALSDLKRRKILSGGK